MSVRSAVREAVRSGLQRDLGSLPKIGLIIAVLAITILRDPLLILQPRLWAEEATWYLAPAYHYAGGPLWYKGLTNVQRGYFALWPNLATTLAANLVALEHVPMVTTLLALTAQVLPVAILLWGKSALWQPGWKRVLGTMIVLFTPLSGEIWLNTINSQFFFSLVVFLILHEDLDLGAARRWGYRVFILVAGLTGTVSGFLMPLFAFKAWFEKGKERWVQTGLLGLSFLAQIILFVTYVKGGDVGAGRFAGVNLTPVLTSLWTQSIALLLFGFDIARRLSQIAVEVYRTAGWVTWLGFWSLALATLFLAFVADGLGWTARITLVGSYLLLLILSGIGSLSGDKTILVTTGNAARYFYVPNVVVMLTVLASLRPRDRRHGGLRTFLLALLLTVCLFQGIAEYPHRLPASPDWPVWQQEIARWREDPSYLVQVWPPGWRVLLRQ